MNQKQFAFDLHYRTEASCGNLSASWCDAMVSPGRLSDEYRKHLADAFGKAGRVYVVLSYATPIAWFTNEDGWWVVTQKFSPTTTRHQNIVRRVAQMHLESQIA